MRTVATVTLVVTAVAWWHRPVRQPAATGAWKPAVPQATRR